MVKTLGKHAQFTPYYVVYNGNSYGCTGVSAVLYMIALSSAPEEGVTRVITPYSLALPVSLPSRNRSK